MLSESNTTTSDTAESFVPLDFAEEAEVLSAAATAPVPDGELELELVGKPDAIIPAAEAALVAEADIIVASEDGMIFRILEAAVGCNKVILVVPAFHCSIF